MVTAALRGPRACRAPRHPPRGDLRAALEQIAAVNSFSVAQVMPGDTPAPCALRDQTPCCQVEELPSHPARGRRHSPFRFGMSVEGYIYVKAARGARRGWRPAPPPDTGSLPVRLHSWIARPRSGLWALHRCDNPRCINPKHIYAGSPADNVRDSYKSGRRAAVAEAPAASPAVVSVNWGVLPPAVTLRESVFCVAGFMDPARKARLAARQGGVTLRPGGGA